MTHSTTAVPHRTGLPSTVDVLVVGGGAAGLNGALVLASARRSVLVVDTGAPRNAPAAGVHGFLSRDGTPPGELLAIGRAEVESYGGTVVDGEVVGAYRSGSRFVVALADGRTVGARRLLVTTGLVDELPAVPGVAERWGRDVLHCPYCHGWEVRDQPVGIIASSPVAMHQVLLFRQWTADLTLFLDDAFEPSDDQWEQLAARGIAVVDGQVAGLDVTEDHIAGVRLASGTVIPVRAVVVAPLLRARSTLLAQLGIVPVPHPSGIGEHIQAGAAGTTEVPGVWVAGNVTDLAAQVVVAAAGGLVAGASINADLVAEDTEHAVADRREPFSAAAEARNSERVLGNRRHGL
ncbi:NAD(P)/FAD-dependent oxidoreductase [Sanguibacter antarcticus]|uniref:Thioredoxin reductase n=1 Tax=Sanguibacter antarcticus TaxID=372484 RepID=A0A2A9E6P0_9MICO|nr:NAD(P)/FAD-dependent oxidoreductase [Sanguibacter antarcticus]PFG34618.1 thioredoxin reductase [Sanguibacter antarcticus]